MENMEKPQKKEKGKYSVPDYIRKRRPKGTCVKVINGNYYVYTIGHVVKMDDGKARRVESREVGTMDRKGGFHPNYASYVTFDTSILEYGPYAIALESTWKVRKEMTRCYPDTGLGLYLLAVIQLVDGFGSLSHLQTCWNRSYMQLKWKTTSMTAKWKKMDAVEKVFSDPEKFLESCVPNKENRQFVRNRIKKSPSPIVVLRRYVVMDDPGDADLLVSIPEHENICLPVILAYDDKGYPLFAKVSYYIEIGPFLQDIHDSFQSKVVVFADGGFFPDGLPASLKESSIPFIAMLPSADSPHGESPDKEGQGLCTERKELGITYYSIKAPDDVPVVNITSFHTDERDPDTIPLHDPYELERLTGVDGTLTVATNIKNGTGEDICYDVVLFRSLAFKFGYFRSIDPSAFCHFRRRSMAILFLITCLLRYEMKSNAPSGFPDIDDCLDMARPAKCMKTRGKWGVGNLTKEVDKLLKSFKVDYKEVIDIPIYGKRK